MPIPGGSLDGQLSRAGPARKKDRQAVTGGGGAVEGRWPPESPSSPVIPEHAQRRRAERRPGRKSVVRQSRDVAVTSRRERQTLHPFVTTT